MEKLLTQSETQIGSPLRGIGKLGLEGTTDAGSAGSLFNKFISGAIGIITVVGAVWFIIILFTGAIGMMTAGSDKNAVENSKKRIVNGLIGLAVLVAGIFILDLIANILGMPDLLNPAKFIDNFSIN